MEMVDIGKIIAPFGIKGEVKVYPYSDFLERIYLLETVLLEGIGFSGSRTIKKAFIHKNLWVIHFEDCESRDDSEALVGLMLKIPASERIPLPEDSYYFDEIIGLDVLTTDGERLGLVEEILKTGGNDVYVVDPGPESVLGDGDEVQDEAEAGVKRKKILLPALKSVILEIDPVKGIMRVELPLGLLD